MAPAKDRSVYVRRRIVVLLALVAVVAAVVLIIVRPGSSGGAKEVASVEVPSDLTEDPEPVSTEETPETPACQSADLDVVAVTDQPSYGAGENPEFSLTVTNSGSEACIADLGTAGMTFAVSSGSDEVWRSADCQTSLDSLPVILDAGEKLETESVSWDRTRSSAETCDITRDAVVAGGASYHLTVSAGGSESKETAQFLLY
ncbi:hypothetical protein [Leucobacter denitrificans]|uniref:DUF4232 domain-containing protein n=1 Tax=Leucobacter denitrificans TaxID=683042 RepID=A0A7G9S4C8_9MICO|nr:hypothetical protein [Leucobacter denitrificans]QNN62703.1 hypothetical protein H9L06_10850 [Leucobacter denitrificans]